uniref:Uncharacterized protein n=1 Tax=Paramoeba aestuarina TaxID=180227 RepID=A0A7S4NR43_9EUKA
MAALNLPLFLFALFFLVAPSTSSNHWPLRHCSDPETCLSALQTCLDQWEGTGTDPCVLFRRCPPGYEYMQDVALDQEICLRLDLGVEDALGASLPDALSPWLDLESCITENSATSAFSRTAPRTLAADAGALAPNVFGGSCFDPYQETLMFMLSNMHLRTAT